jgi:translation initiation factor IF-2
MTKLRVYELARELNVETKVLLSKLKGAARNLSHQSTLTDQQVAELRSAFGVVAPPSAVHTSEAGKPRVVIRRRVASSLGEGEGSSFPASSSADVGEADFGAMTGVSESAIDRPSAQATADAAMDHEAFSDEAVAESEEPVSMTETVEPVSTKDTTKEAAIGQQALGASSEADASPVSVVATPTVPPMTSTTPAAPATRASSTSATIVRSASSSTVQAQRPASQGQGGSAGGGYQGRPATGRPDPASIQRPATGRSDAAPIQRPVTGRPDAASIQRPATSRPDAASVARPDQSSSRDDRLRAREATDGREVREPREQREPVREQREARSEVSRREEGPRGGAGQPRPQGASQAAPGVPAAAPQGGPTAAAARRRDVGGATIVRRATPEEVENLQSLAAKRQQAGRKEDHRGTRVTGIGLLQNRISAEGTQAPASNAPPPPPSEEDMWGQRRGPAAVKDKKTLDEEEQARKRAAKNRRTGTGSSVNMRVLLDQIEDLSGADEEVAKEQPGRVYTPSAARSKRELKRRKDLKKTQITTPRASYRVVEMEDGITVGELAKQLAVKAPEIIKKLMLQGVMATINQVIDFDTAALIANDYGFEIKSVVQTVEDILNVAPVVESDLEDRAPIVTVMGHVDHGKTSILDAIRSANVARGEAGGITQHIGAYSVERDGKRITFLDTPGHEAFSAMRARGAKVTDIVVLVVAADDGVMPQTKEAVSHAKAANVPLIVAINKIDKPNVNLDRVYKELTELGVQAEEWGGETQFIKCSALQRKGIDELLDAVLLQAEVLDLKATRQGFAEGAVIEAHLDRGRGPVATIVVQRGTLKVGDYIVAGTEYGRIRAMHDHLGHDTATAGPADPVEVIGLSGVPMAGDKFNVVLDEKTAREAGAWRLDQAKRAAAGKSSAATLEDLLARVKSEDVPEVPIIVKADTQGSLEAICETIVKLSTPKVRNRVIHSAVGGVTESDVTLAQASNSLLIGFNVRANRGLEEYAERVGVPVRYFSIIYEIIDAVKAIMVGKLPPIVSELVLGHAEVRKPISVPKIGTIAGSAVLDGKITRASLCRLIRDNVVIYTGKLGSLRRFKDDVKEVAQGYECGIGIDGYNDLREGDVIEAFVLEEHAATL